MVKMRSAYYPHTRVQFENEGPSMTQQNFRDETNINNILAKYAKTGLIDHINKYSGRYENMPDEDDFHAAMNLVLDAQSMFFELPSDLRSRFENDPGQFLEFLDNPENIDELREMGLMPPAAPEATAEPPTAPVPGDPAPEPPTAPTEPS